MTMTDFTQDAMSVASDMTAMFNRRDYASMVENCGGTVDYTEVGTGRHVTDPGAFVELLEGWVSAMPDVQGTVLSAMRDGDRLCCEIRWEGTQTGPLETPSGTLPASGNRAVTRAVQLFTIRDGRVVDITHYVDALGLLTQLTAVPAPADSPEQGAPVSA